MTWTTRPFLRTLSSSYGPSSRASNSSLPHITPTSLSSATRNRWAHVLSLPERPTFRLEALTNPGYNKPSCRSWKADTKLSPEGKRFTSYGSNRTYRIARTWRRQSHAVQADHHEPRIIGRRLCGLLEQQGRQDRHRGQRPGHGRRSVGCRYSPNQSTGFEHGNQSRSPLDQPGNRERLHRRAIAHGRHRA